MDDERAERYPVDYDAIRQGDRIEPGRLAEVLGARPRTYKYQLRLLKMCKQIERELWDRGRRWTVRICNDGINVLTAAEASQYNDRLCSQRRQQEARSFLRLSAVDVGELPPDTLKAHDRRMLVNGAYIAAQSATRRTLRPVAHERQHPRLTAD